MPDASAATPIAIERLDVAAYRVPTDRPESDGTIAWNSTTMVVVDVFAEGERGQGWSYTDSAAAPFIRDTLARVVRGRSFLSVGAAWTAMNRQVRNIGRPGIASAAISAIDVALWDLEARRLGVPLARLFGAVRDAVPIYGSGGFTSYTPRELQEQLAHWVEQGIRRVKMKVGREPDRDVERVRAARDAVGADTELFVDANGGYTRKQALRFAESFAELDVRWFEEPVPSDDLRGLRFLSERVPGGMEVAAGEYGHDVVYFRRMLEAGAVDVLQADATRCGGYSGFLRASALCEAFSLDLSAHTAPWLHLPVAAASLPLRHIEYFHDHVRIETMLFDGVAEPIGGMLRVPDDRPGHGLVLKRQDAEKYRVA